MLSGARFFVCEVAQCGCVMEFPALGVCCGSNATEIACSCDFRFPVENDRLANIPARQLRGGKGDIRYGTDGGKAELKKLTSRLASTLKVVEAHSESPCRAPRH